MQQPEPRTEHKVQQRAYPAGGSVRLGVIIFRLAGVVISALLQYLTAVVGVFGVLFGRMFIHSCKMAYEL